MKRAPFVKTSMVVSPKRERIYKKVIDRIVRVKPLNFRIVNLALKKAKSFGYLFISFKMSGFVFTDCQMDF